MLAMKKEEVIKGASNMISLIKEELTQSFQKTPEESETLIRNAKVYDSLVRRPIGLHDPPYNWALIVLAKNKDYRTIEKYDHS